MRHTSFAVFSNYGSAVNVLGKAVPTCFRKITIDAIIAASGAIFAVLRPSNTKVHPEKTTVKELRSFYDISVSSYFSEVYPYF